MKGATSTEYNLELEMIFIIGGRLVIGWHDRDFEGQFTLSLTGDPDNEYYVNEDWETGIPVPSNSLGRLTLILVHSFICTFSMQAFNESLKFCNPS